MRKGGAHATGVFELAQQHAPAAGLAQHEPVPLTNGPVFVSGQSQSCVGKETRTFVTLPMTMVATPMAASPVPPAEPGHGSLPEPSALVEAQTSAPNTLLTQLMNMSRPVAPSAAKSVTLPVAFVKRNWWIW